MSPRGEVEFPKVTQAPPDTVHMCQGGAINTFWLIGRREEDREEA